MSPTRQAPREEPPAHAAPGAGARAALRLIDACIAPLQRLRKRFDPDSEEHTPAAHGHAAPAGHADADAASDSETAGTAPRRPSLLLRLLVILLALGLGLAAGGFLAWQKLSAQLAEHDSVVERLQDDINAAAKEEVQRSTLVDKLQRENGEYRQQMREARREAAFQQERADELEQRMQEQQLAAKRAEAAKKAAAEPTPPAKPVGQAASRRTPARASAPQKSGHCEISAEHPDGDLTTCLDNYNKR